MDNSPPHSTSVESLDGQVCDRCRLKKIRCDGVSSERSSCTNCTTAEVECQVSVRLQRKTKSRGYKAASNGNQSTIRRLEQENAELQAKLRAEIEASNILRRELDLLRQERLISDTRPQKLRRLNDEVNFGVQSPRVSLSGSSDVLPLPRSACVIKHMGRMVFDEDNVGRFAGSTTGVHFVASVEDLCRQNAPGLRPFPMDCFRLHLFQQKQHTSTEYSDDTARPMLETVRELFAYSLEYYTVQIDTFNLNWLAFCPVLPRTTFIRDITSTFEDLYSRSILSTKSSSTILSMTMILLINQCWLEDQSTEYPTQIVPAQYIALACRLLPQVTATGDICSLQAIILFSLYLQLAGHTSWLIPINGIQVRLAQSLGMHRHARRFRLSASEIELRKRMWWWIYSFDKFTSLIHGLPQLINEDDVDNDLPIDCDLNDTNSNELSHPLPGEPSSIVLYIQSVKLHRLIALILRQLYTTNQRRGGEEKITRLDRDLRVWHQNFNSELQVSLDVFDTAKTFSTARLMQFGPSDCYAIARLDILASFAFILIHRPAITFDSGTQQFRGSLKECVNASSYIIQLANTSPTHQRALDMFPLGASVIFQCALLHIFHELHTDHILLTNQQPSHRAMIARAIDVLNTSTSRSESPIISTVSLLQMLQRTFLGPNETRTEDETETTDINDTAVAPRNELYASLDMDFWTFSTLGSLNQLDVFDGGFDEVGTFGIDGT